jgi:hypothetical protein
VRYLISIIVVVGSLVGASFLLESVTSATPVKPPVSQVTCVAYDCEGVYGDITGQQQGSTP